MNCDKSIAGILKNGLTTSPTFNDRRRPNGAAWGGEMSKKRNPAVKREVSIEYKGKTYNATYTVEKGIITVSTLYGKKATQVGGSPPESLARIMIRELVDEGKI
jgi:hypothetical protein